MRALGVARAGRSAVYDLQVEGSPEFFANGVLTHNTRYVAMERVWYLRPDGQHVEPWSLASGRMPTREQWRAMHRPTAALMGKYS